MLPKSINIKNLKTKHPSRPRNELLADIFFKAGLIEAWGQGTLEIINLCRTANLPEPEYKEEFGGFSTTFFQSDYSTNKIKLLNLNSRQEKTIEYLKENNSVTNSIYQKFFKVSKGTATKDLNDLLEKEKQKSLRLLADYQNLEKQTVDRINAREDKIILNFLTLQKFYTDQ